MVQPRSARPHKFTEWECRVLKHIAHTNLLSSVQHSLPSSKLPLEATLAQELFVGSFMKVVSMAEQPKIPNAKCRLEWGKALRHRTLKQSKRVLWSDESRFTI